MLLQQEYYLKLSCKKIKSGKCQVRFKAEVNPGRFFYGYYLASPNDKLKDVVSQLNERLSLLQRDCDPFHFHLYSIGKNDDHQNNFLIFHSKL